MANGLSSNIDDREFHKFLELSSKTAVRVGLTASQIQEIADAINAGLGVIKREYSEVSAVPSLTETVIVSKAIGPEPFRLKMCEVSGDNIATYKVKIDSVTVAKKRTWWANFNEIFFFGKEEIANKTISITVEHKSSDPGDFEGSIIGEQI